MQWEPQKPRRVWVQMLVGAVVVLAMVAVAAGIFIGLSAYWATARQRRNG